MSSPSDVRQRRQSGAGNSSRARSSTKGGGDLLPEGMLFGDYRIERCLSTGFLGEIYRAHRGEEEMVCMAVLPLAVNEAPGFPQRLSRYVERIRGLIHENILTVNGYEEIRGRHCLLLEPFDGVCLGDYVKEILVRKRAKSARRTTGAATEPGLPPAEVQQLLTQTAAALHCAHSAQITHHFLSPASLFRTTEGQVKLFGLGFLEVLGQDLFERLVSLGIPPIKSGSQRLSLNPLDGLSPEARLGKPTDKRSDVYALGLLGYFLLTARKPETPLRPPSHYASGIAAELDSAIVSALQAAPEDRPPSGGAFRKALKRGAGTATAKDGKTARPTLLGRLLLRGKPRVLRLAAGGVAALAVMAATYGAVHSLFLGGEPDGPLVQRASAATAPPNLTLRVSPARAQVIFNGTEKFLAVDGRLQVRAVPGRYNVRLVSPGYHPAVRELRVSDTPGTVDIILDPAYAVFELSSQTGVQLSVLRESGAVPLGVTDAEGKLRLKNILLEGTHTLRLSRPAHQPVTLEGLELSSAEPTVREIFLQPVPASVEIVSEPAGATVTIDGEAAGTTPLTTDTFPVNRTVAVELSLPGYRLHRQELSLRPAENVFLDFGALEKSEGAVEPVLTLDGAPLPESFREALTIRIGGETYAATRNRLENVPAGTQPVVLEHPDLLPWEGTLEVLDAGKVRLVADLQPREAVVAFTIRGSDGGPPPPFEVLVNGRPRALDKTGRLGLEPDGVHQIEVRAPDHLTLKRAVELGPNERLPWTVRLQPIPAPEAERPWEVPYIGLKMAWVGPGDYTMGSPLKEPERLPSEGPATTVRLPDGFWAGRYEVRQSEFAALMGRNPSRFEGAAKPVEQVSWEAAMEYCRRLTEKERAAGRLPEGYVYRLPTEAEWEYVCRAGSDDPFAFGAYADAVHGNFKGTFPREAHSGESEVYGTRAAGSYPPNNWGLYDMHGNVREWCLDLFSARLPGGEESRWLGDNDTGDRAYRGGGWEDFAGRCRSAARDRLAPDTVSPSLGFRVILAPAVEGLAE